MAAAICNNLEDKNEVFQIDSRTLQILNRWSLSPGESPSGMAIDAVNRRLFVGCRNRKLIVMDSDTGKVVTTVPIGEAVDAIDSTQARRLYSARMEMAP